MLRAIINNKSGFTEAKKLITKKRERGPTRVKSARPMPCTFLVQNNHLVSQYLKKPSVIQFEFNH